MELDSITTLISNVGFPIMCVLALGWFVYKSYDRIMTNNQTREDKLYEMIGKTQAQLDQAQDTNAKFLSVLDQINKDTEQMKTDIDVIKDTLRQLPKRKTDKEVKDGE